MLIASDKYGGVGSDRKTTLARVSDDRLTKAQTRCLFRTKSTEDDMTSGITDEEIQEAVAKLSPRIARVAREISRLTGEDYETTKQDLSSYVFCQLRKRYDPQKGASPFTFGYYQIKGWLTATLRKHEKDRLLVDPPEDYDPASGEEEVEETIEKSNLAALLPADLVRRIISEHLEGKPTICTAKELAVAIIQSERRFGI